FGFADEVIHAYATERVLALGTPKLWITLWFMLLVYYNFNIQGDRSDYKGKSFSTIRKKSLKSYRLYQKEIQ
ncbi:hypothetical protein KZ367_10055, partial [Glaesserella parasuis]|nr:hypothetical protein [Glaesserella parasuis]MDD2156635.1 hypothetical protein [Glaesserella parasuis]